MSDTEKELGGQLLTAQIPGTTNDAQPAHRLETGLATDLTWETDAPRQKPQVARVEDSDYSDAAASPTGRHDRLMSKRKSQPKVQEASAGETRHQETTLSRIANYPLDGTHAGVSASAPARQHSRSSSVSSRNSRFDDRLEVLEHSVHSMAQLISAHFARPNSTQTPGVSLIHPRVDHLSPVRNERLTASEPLMSQTQFVPPAVSHVPEGGSWQPGTNRSLPNGGTGWLAKALRENCLHAPSDLQKSIAVMAVTPTAKYWNGTLRDAEDELSRTKQKLDMATPTSWPAELELVLPVLYQHEQSRCRLKTMKQRLERNGGLDEQVRQMIEAEELSQTTAQLKILHSFFDLDSDWIPAEMTKVAVHPTARLAFLHAVHMMRDHLAGDDVQQKVEQFRFHTATTLTSTRITNAVARETDCVWATVGPDYTWLRRMNRKLGSS
jgi:hypothetical protein